MAETLKAYWRRNSYQETASSFATAITNAASDGPQLRDAAAFVAAIEMVDTYGGTLRDKVFERTKQLLARDSVDMGAKIGPEPIDEAGSLAEALRLLN